MLTIQDTLNLVFPDLKWIMDGSDPNDYTKLSVISGEKPPYLDVLTQRVLLCKEEKIRGLSGKYKELIMGGFVSNALGTDHRYDSELEDQLNIMGSVLACLVGQLPGMVYGCLDVTKEVKEYKFHTQQQLATVFATGAQIKLNLLQTFHTKRLYILGLPNVEATIGHLESVTWDSVDTGV